MTNLPDVQLKLYKSNDDFSLTNLRGEGEKTQSVVKDVLSEISTSNQVTELETQLSENYEMSIKKHLSGWEKEQKKHLDNFLAVKKQIDGWKNDKNVKTPPPSISKEHGISLQKMYELYSELLTEKQKLSGDLMKIRTIEGTVTPETSNPTRERRPSLDKIKSSLNRILWKGDVIKITKTRGPKTQMWKNDWGKWEDNPYKYFYEGEEEFKKAISSLNKISGSIAKERQRISRERSWTSWPRATQSFQLQDDSLDNMETNIISLVELQVAKKLLEGIGR